jgi:hypothetical protein
MNYKQEFRYFDFDIPHIEGFTDKSWHNDVSPSFIREYDETRSVVFWVDYLEESRRECGGKQFTLVFMLTNDEEELYSEPEYILETNSWDEAINKLNELFNEVKK